MSNGNKVSASDEQQDEQVSQPLVLLVGHREDERQAFTQLVIDIGFQVGYAASGGEALEMLEDHDVALLVMDIQLPDMHGWQFLSKVKEIDMLRNLPIIVISDQSDLSNTVASVEYLRRPVSISRLRQHIEFSLNSR
jgi:CheY-like chemotaxis protein